MTTKAQIKAKLRIIRSPIASIVIADVVRGCKENWHQVSPETHAIYVKGLIEWLEAKYKQEYDSIDKNKAGAVKVSQIDLEDSIREIKAEKQEYREEDEFGRIVYPGWKG